jgi:hypothetical protein
MILAPKMTHGQQFGLEFFCGGRYIIDSENYTTREISNDFLLFYLDEEPMRFAAIAIALSLTISAPVFGYEASKHPKADPTGSTFDRGRIQIHKGNWQGAIDLFHQAISEDRKTTRPTPFWATAFATLAASARPSPPITARLRLIQATPS